MRLINAQTLALEDFGEHGCPKYAILSHTWESEEVSYQQWMEPGHNDHLQGFAKIRGFLGLAATHYNLSYAWVDTCCIDKSSSAELAETINSMYRYYEEAAICIIYLADVPADCTSLGAQAVRDSRWFTRGWTLQELLAPSRTVFYNKAWNLLGYMSPLIETSEDIIHVARYTGIPELVLSQVEAADEYSVATRMGWASHRQTTRVEDEAYSLLGMFGVSLPLIYGEGRRAFIRLQEEIIRRSTDHSIFAWTPVGDMIDDHLEDRAGDLLARSPSDFAYAAETRVLECLPIFQSSTETYEVNNLGLRLQLPLIECSTPGQYHAVLNCRFEDEPMGPIAITVMADNSQGGSDDSTGELPRTFYAVNDNSSDYACYTKHLSRIAVVAEEELIGTTLSDVTILRNQRASVLETPENRGQAQYNLSAGWTPRRLRIKCTMFGDLDPLQRVEAVPSRAWLHSGPENDQEIEGPEYLAELTAPGERSVTIEREEQSPLERSRAPNAKALRSPDGQQSAVTKDNICVANDKSMAILYEASWLEGLLVIALVNPLTHSHWQAGRVDVALFSVSKRASRSTFLEQLLHFPKLRTYTTSLDDDESIMYFLQEVGVSVRVRLVCRQYAGTNFLTLSLHLHQKSTHLSTRHVALPMFHLDEFDVFAHRPVVLAAESLAEDSSETWTLDTRSPDSLIDSFEGASISKPRRKSRISGRFSVMFKGAEDTW